MLIGIADPSSMQVACHIWTWLLYGVACHEAFIAQWLEHPDQCAEGPSSIPVGDLDIFLCPALVTWWSHLFLYHFNIFFSLTALPIPSVRCHCQGPEDHSIFLLLQHYGEHHVQWEELWLITQLHCSWLWVKASFSLSRNLGDIQSKHCWTNEPQTKYTPKTAQTFSRSKKILLLDCKSWTPERLFPVGLFKENELLNIRSMFWQAHKHVI